MNQNNRRKRLIGRSECGPFLALPKAVVIQMQKKNLSTKGYKLLIDLFEQFNGKNNGDLTAAWSIMKEKGWKSSETLSNARKELVNLGFIQLTRQGTLRPRSCSLYAVTWLCIDECGGKLEVKSTRAGSGAWQSSK